MKINIKFIFRLSLILLVLGIISLLIELGLTYKDSYYFILATIVLFISIGSLLKREKLPQLSVPKISLHLNLRKILSNISKFQPAKLKAELSNKKIFRGKKRFIFIESAILSIFLAYLIVYQLPSVTQNRSFFGNLVGSYLSYFEKYPVFASSLIAILIIFNLFIILRLSKKGNFLRKLLNSVVNSVVSILISIPASLIIVFVSLLVLYNSLIIVSGFSPKFLGIHTDKNEIKQIIDKEEGGFELIGITESPSKTFVINSPFFGQKGGYFSENLISSLPNILFISSTTINRPVYLIRNTLIIKELDKDVFQTFAPTLVKKLVRKALSPRYIKDEPSVEIISRQDYLKYREEQINEQIDEITGYINEAKKALGVIAYNIQVSKNNIATLQNYISLNTQYRDKEYNDCVSATWTYYGWYSNYTYRLYSDEYCLSQRAKRDQQNAEYQSGLETNQRDLSYSQSQYNEFKEYLGQFENYKVFIEATKQLTPYELGLFEPQSTIKVVLDSVSDKDISNFLETLTHEYLHYSSYVSEERSLPQFFEEGITELLAQRVISNQLHKKVNLGYPAVVKVIEAMTNNISLTQFEDIYFNKSADELESLLNQTYGKDFYKDTELYFALIPLSPTDEALKFVNNIMVKIGGQTLEENELNSN